MEEAAMTDDPSQGPTDIRRAAFPEGSDEAERG